MSKNRENPSEQEGFLYKTQEKIAIYKVLWYDNQKGTQKGKRGSVLYETF